MFDTLVKKVFGSQSDREYKKSLPAVDLVNQLADRMSNLSDDELKSKTAEFRQQLNHRIQKQSSRIGHIEEELINDLEPDVRERLNDEYELSTRHQPTKLFRIATKAASCHENIITVAK